MSKKLKSAPIAEIKNDAAIQSTENMLIKVDTGKEIKIILKKRRYRLVAAL
jgi:hypothetical protein